MGMFADIATEVDRGLVIEALEKELAKITANSTWRLAASAHLRGRVAGIKRAIEIVREVLTEGR